MDITEKLETIKHRWEEMGEQLADPAVASDMKKFVKNGRTTRRPCRGFRHEEVREAQQGL